MKNRSDKRTTEPGDNPHEALARIFHEPNRLAIVSALCSARQGLTFGELKETCGLTDGNLNRHLKALVEDGAVRIEKSFVAAKPRTTVYLTKTGLARFDEYLSALEEVLEKARRAVAGDERKAAACVPAGKTVLA
jgi:DNA-binding transcriptional ArsR family regulator